MHIGDDREALDAPWDAQALSGEFDRIYEQILLADNPIRVIHDAWKALGGKKSASCYRNERIA